MIFFVGFVIGAVTALVLVSALFLFNEDDKIEQFRWSLTRAIGSLSEDEKGRVNKKTVLNIIRDLGGFYD